MTFKIALNNALDIRGYPKTGRIGAFHNAVKKIYPKISYESVRKWISGESMPQTSRISDIAKILQVKPDDLLSGSGELTSSYEIKEDRGQYADKTITSIIAAWPDLPLDIRRSIWTIIDRMTKQSIDNRASGNKYLGQERRL